MSALVALCWMLVAIAIIVLASVALAKWHATDEPEQLDLFAQVVDDHQARRDERQATLRKHLGVTDPAERIKRRLDA